MGLCFHAIRREGIRAGAAMAIKFVDIEPEDGKPKKAEAPKAKPQAGVEKGAAEPESADGELPLHGLPHAKPAPNKRGRR